MSFFQQFQGSRLYIAGGNDPGWLAYQFPPGSPLPDPGPDLLAALTTYPGSFVFSATAPDLGTAAALDKFLTAVDAVIQAAIASRGFVWLRDLANIVPARAPMMGLNGAGTATVGQFVAPIFSTLSLNAVGGISVSLAGDTLQITQAGGGRAIFFAGAASPGPNQASEVSSAALPLTGPRRGCLQLDIFLQRLFLATPAPAGFGWGFQFLAPTPATESVRSAFGVSLPLAFDYLPDGSDMIGFALALDPSDPLNRRSEPAARPTRSVLVFTGRNQNSQPTLLVSGFATPAGASITLTPLPGPLDNEPRAARLVFNEGPPISGGTQFQVAPDGDFVMSVASLQPDRPAELICGLHGTEWISLQPAGEGVPGDRLTFTSRQPAYAPRYPFQQSSPILPPVDPNAPLLDTTYTTSWASVFRGPSASTVVQTAIVYVAQPKGGPLYGRDPLIHEARKTLFGALDPSILLPQDLPVPMAPYGAVTPGDGTTGFTDAQIEDFESAVLGPTRRRLIGATAPALAPSRAAATRGVAGEAFNTTTPTGLLVGVGGDGKWNKILLGQNLSPAQRQMYFCQPDASLQEAFQTGQLCLVVANAVHLGALSGSGSGACGSSAAFYNRMNVGAWEFQADVGQSNRYDDYTNVMIVKGRKGALWDPNDKEGSIVANPSQWTLKDVFAAPSDLVANPNPPPTEKIGDPNPDELVALSFWLQRYFQAAVDQQDTDYFGNFNRIAKDPNWTGILVLRLTIAQLPDDLVGIRAGVTAPDLFNAHHFGIEISQVANDPNAKDIELSTSSSMFGLIYYVDPAFTPPVPPAPPEPVAPAVTGANDFRLLTLKALFQNTAVQKFQSYAQLTFGSLFEMPVDHMGPGGNPYATIVLTGSYQDNGGQAVYSLATATTSTFYFDSNIFNKIEIDSAQMTTRNTGKSSGTVVCWFGLTGYLDFAVIDDTSGNAFDLLSFGSPKGSDALRQGLAFANLGLTMSFPVANPPGRSIVFTTSDIRFDVAHSTPRDGSLYGDFALGLQSLAVGTKDSTPDGAGYLPVLTDAPLGGVDGGNWYGLTFQLDMGSPGALAAGAGLKSGLLAAWSPESSGAGDYQALLGIKLPGTGGGAKLISLQNVLKLSIGQIRLTRAKQSFLLMLTEIALKFLGLLKLPPNGSTLFYLFGNPKSGGKAAGLGWYAMYRNPGGSTKQSAPTAQQVQP